LSILAPQDGAVVGGIVYISGELEYAPEVLSIGFYIDDTLRFFKPTEPYVYAWHVTSLPDSSVHQIYLKASMLDEDYAYSETVYVMIYNTTLIAEDFENYTHGEYPALGGWFGIWPGSGYEGTHVDTACGYNSDKSFKLSGTPAQVRTDGVCVNLQNVHEINYECAVMVPEGASAGALLGFFISIDPSLGTILNGMLFDHDDHMIYARGLSPMSTGMSWQNDIWYTVKVFINYDSHTMDVWVNERLLLENVHAAPRDTSDIFAISTEVNGSGAVYFDDIEVYK
jgi:hypothetical protein